MKTVNHSIALVAISALFAGQAFAAASNESVLGDIYPSYSEAVVIEILSDVDVSAPNEHDSNLIDKKFTGLAAGQIEGVN